MKIRSLFAFLCVASLCFVAANREVLANHSWGGYHWAGGSLRAINVGDNVSGAWDAYLTEAIDDWNHPGTFGWNDAPVIYLQPSGGGTNPKNCRPTAGRIEVCNSSYGKTNWLGIATVWINGGHITQATTKLNDTYFNTATYNTPAWRRLVTCQEVAHDFGLGHQDENFDNANKGSCMDYTSDPSGASKGQLSNEHPNYHDFQQLDQIYNHVESAGAGAPTATQGAGNAPSEWGRLVHSNSNGRVQVYERNLGNAGIMITHVFWADPVNDARDR
jgi:hypothetical protein